MNDATSTVGSRPTRSALYKSEMRFGVVMYGGVSLAIYINGVANELYEMACATPKVGENAAVSGTRKVYRKASLLLGSKELRDRYVAHLADKDPNSDPFAHMDLLAEGERVRFVVDVISGTSAGGINGAFLAKALANGQEFSPLKKLWIQEGDIDGLLNDDASYKGLEYARNDTPPRSLLNSDRMYLKLLDAFENMKTAIPPVSPTESALADEIDLYMTTTDIRGTVVPLRLFDEVAYERRFRQVYHFQYGTSGNDLADDNAPFLAFAARCTSSFPFAFEPMTVDDAQRLCDVKPGDDSSVEFDDWKRFFTGLSARDLAGTGWRSRAFGDGGYLDNKPFSYVVEALSWRLGYLPMERKLIYVEPAPAHPETERQTFADKPDALENAFNALNTIPQYETIREDLEAVLARNRRIERVERIVRRVEADVEFGETNPLERIKLDENGDVPQWTSLDLQTMIDYYGTSFLPYHRLRIAAATDYVAERLAICWKVDRRSDKAYALTAMARVWREAHYYENKSKAKGDQTASVNKFLNDYDIKYQLRRAGFMLRKVHQLRSLAINMAQGKDPKKLSDIEYRLWERLEKRQVNLWEDRDGFVDALNCLADGFGQSMQELRETVWPRSPCPGTQPDATACATLDLILRLILGEKLDPALAVLYSSDGKPVKIALDELPSASRLRTLQENVFERASKLYELAHEPASLTAIQQQLEKDLEALRDNYARAVHRPFDAKKPRIRDLLGNPQLKPAANRKGAVIQIDPEVDACGGALNNAAGRAMRAFLAEYYIRFDEYDQMSFPLYYDTGTGEPSTVEVLRVSPEDARGLIDERQEQGDAGRQRRKLAGTFLANFGAFLDARWRRNDIMWGRLDGCERLLSALFPPTGDKEADTGIDAMRNALLLEAQCAIVREEMQPEGYEQLLDGFATTLAAQSESVLKKAFSDLWANLTPAEDSDRRRRMALAIKEILGDAGMVEYVRRFYEVNRKLDAEAVTKTGARALTITGRILEGSEKHYRVEGSRMVWVTRAGRGLQALLTISTPGSLPRAVFRHWLVLLYSFELLIVAGAMAFSAPEARTFGLTCLGVTIALHAASLVAGDLMKGKWKYLGLLAFGLTILVLVLASLGGFALSNGSLKSIMCAGDQHDFGWLLKRICLP